MFYLTCNGAGGGLRRGRTGRGWRVILTDLKVLPPLSPVFKQSNMSYKRPRTYQRPGFGTPRTRPGARGTPIRYARRTYGRVGYPSVARTRGAAVQGEMKYYDASQYANVPVVTTTWPAANVSDPTTVLSLVNPVQGAGINERVGRKIKLMKLKVRGYIEIPKQSVSATSDDSTFIRIMLVKDCQTNATQMQAAQLMSGASDAHITIASFQSTENFGRFTVLKDKMIPIGNANMTGAAGAIEQSGLVRPFKFNITFKYPVLINFNGTSGGTIADIVDNSFHIVAATNLLALAPKIVYYSRACYKE